MSDLEIGCDYIFEYDPTLDFVGIIDEDLAVRSGNIVTITNFPDTNMVNVLFDDDSENTVAIGELCDIERI